MKKDLSIIIAHYQPENFNDLNPLLETIKTIETQNSHYNIEIIISDDGSFYSKEIIDNYSIIKEISNHNRHCYIWNENMLAKWLKMNNISTQLISNWVYIPKSDPPSMSKSRTLNQSVALASSDNLLFLDDDNYFISQDSINALIKLLNEYSLVIGQVKDNNGRLRSYESNRVQGTTISMKKNIFDSINGFGEWTEKFSCGVDSDLWIKLYNYFLKNNDLKACYTNKVSTFDSQSKRWKKYTKFFKEWSLKKEFYKIHNCKNYKSAKSNLSRQKHLWLENLIQ